MPKKRSVYIVEYSHSFLQIGLPEVLPHLSNVLTAYKNFLHIIGGFLGGPIVSVIYSVDSPECHLVVSSNPSGLLRKG